MWNNFFLNVYRSHTDRAGILMHVGWGQLHAWETVFVCGWTLTEVARKNWWRYKGVPWKSSESHLLLQWSWFLCLDALVNPSLTYSSKSVSSLGYGTSHTLDSHLGWYPQQEWKVTSASHTAADWTYQLKVSKESSRTGR